MSYEYIKQILKDLLTEDPLLIQNIKSNDLKWLNSVVLKRDFSSSSFCGDEVNCEEPKEHLDKALLRGISPTSYPREDN